MRVDIYAINLKTRPDRCRRLVRMFDNMDIVQAGYDYKILQVDPPQEGGRVGCFESHVNCFKASDADICVVFEDDVVWDGKVSWEKIMKVVKQYFGPPYNKDFFSIGCICFPLSPDYNRNRTKVVENISFITTTCYAVTKRCIDNILPALDFLIKNPDTRKQSLIHIDAVMNCIIPVEKKAGFACPAVRQYDLGDTDNSWFPDTGLHANHLVKKQMESYSRQHLTKVFKHKKLTIIDCFLDNVVHEMHMTLVRGVISIHSIYYKKHWLLKMMEKS